MRTDTPSPELLQIRAGHYVEQRGYQCFRRRGTNDFLLIYTRSGSGRFTFNGRHLATAPGQLVLLDPKTRHDYGIADESAHWELLWAHFHAKREWHAWLALPELCAGFRSLWLNDAELRARVEHRLTEMVRFANGPERHAESLGMNALEEVLLWCDLQNPQSGDASIDPRIRRALDLLCSDLTSGWSLTELARRCALSRSRFALLFRAQTGTTPQRYLEEQRITRARELLELTQRSIAQVAEDVGFSSPFYFSMRFKRLVGKSPSEYREERR